MKKSTIIIQLVMFLVVIVALFLYYPFAYRTITTLINADWWNSIGQANAGHYINEKSDIYNSFISNILSVVAFIIGFFALPGVFLLTIWNISKNLEIASSRPNSSIRSGRRKMHRPNEKVDTKSLNKIYNQLKNMELEIDTKFQSLREELRTEINNEIRRMFDMKTEAENCVDKARTLLKTENYDEALKACNMAVELTPFGAAYYVRGAVYHKMGIEEQALNDLNTAATLGYQKAQDVLSVMGVAS